MSRLNLSLACWNYDRTEALQTGAVTPEMTVKVKKKRKRR